MSNLLADLRENRLLRALPEAERHALAGAAQPLSLPPGRDLCILPSRPHVYFPLSGAVDLLLALDDGFAADAALIGREGIVGFPGEMALHRAPWEALTLLPTEVLAVPADSFADLLERAPCMRSLAERYSALLLESSVQLSGCSHFHELAPRLARLLLQLADHGGNQIRIGQDVLARVLGSYRPTVTLALQGLRGSRLIENGRLRIVIVDRPGLERTACACYARLRESRVAFTRELRASS
ncbi:MAG: Crp/Fnr family transcriptional regulator [Dehalococcoidia bacterium]